VECGGSRCDTGLLACLELRTNSLAAMPKRQHSPEAARRLCHARRTILTNCGDTLSTAGLLQ
jgi:hypothetical protein